MCSHVCSLPQFACTICPSHLLCLSAPHSFPADLSHPSTPPMCPAQLPHPSAPPMCPAQLPHRSAPRLLTTSCLAVLQCAGHYDQDRLGSLHETEALWPHQSQRQHRPSGEGECKCLLEFVYMNGGLRVNFCCLCVLYCMCIVYVSFFFSIVCYH